MYRDKLCEQKKQLENNKKENTNQQNNLDRLKDEHGKCFKTRVVLGNFIII